MIYGIAFGFLAIVELGFWFHNNVNDDSFFAVDFKD